MLFPKIQFGTDFPFGEPKAELQEILRLGFREDMAEALLCRNVMCLLNRSPRPPSRGEGITTFLWWLEEREAMEAVRPITIRRCSTEDLPSIARITSEVFEPFCIDAIIERVAGQGGAEWLAIKTATIRKEVGDNADGCFVAEHEGTVVGFVTTVVNGLASRGTISNVAVSRPFQGQGLGRRLLSAALQYFRSLGLRHAKIETLECNVVGEHLYKSAGFREVVRQIHFIMRLE